MSPSKKSAKKHYPLPLRVDFNTWKTRVRRSLTPNSREAKALKCWFEKEAAICAKIGKPEGATRDSLLESVYIWTRPQLASEAEREKHESVAHRLKNLQLAIESALGAIRACNSEVLPEGSMLPLDLSELTSNLEETTFHIRCALLFLDQPYERSGKVISYCWMFIRELQRCVKGGVKGDHRDGVKGNQLEVR
jgi:hypothetical protein